MHYCGIDPSLTQTGLVVINQDGRRVKQGDFGTKSNMPMYDRLYKIAGFVGEIVTDYHLDIMVGIESPSYHSRNTRSLVDLGGLYWAITMRLVYGLLIKPIPVAPTAVKKYASGKGNMKSSDIRLLLMRQGKEFSSEDTCVAYCIAQMMRSKHFMQTGREIALTKYQIETLEKLS